MYVCMYLCNVCMYAMYVCMYVCMFVCMHGWMHACMHACIHAWMYVCMHVHSVFSHIQTLSYYLRYFMVCPMSKNEDMTHGRLFGIVRTKILQDVVMSCNPCVFEMSVRNPGFVWDLLMNGCWEWGNDLYNI